MATTLPADATASAVIPSSTYRFQFHSGFKLARAIELVDYLYTLGVGTVYCSPLLKARAGSTHGYDTIDHAMINPEIGTYDEFVTLSRKLKSKGMGLLLDIVPNHMGVHSDNLFWYSVLEYGQSSPYKSFFDINWNHEANPGKILVPTLGAPIGQCIEKGELKVIISDAQKLEVRYWDTKFPLAPITWHTVLALAHTKLGETDADSPASQKIVLYSQQLTADGVNKPDSIYENAAAMIKSVQGLIQSSPNYRAAVEAAIKEINTNKARLADLMNNQPYRLAYYRVATDEINYRRFFEVTELMAVRVEDPAVFKKTHDFVLTLVSEGLVDGLRVDHPDGLYDPAQYINQLQLAAAKAKGQSIPTDKKSIYLLVEKILQPGEDLPKDWPVHGTTGYDYMNVLNSVFVQPAGGPEIKACWKAFTHDNDQSVEDRLIDTKLAMIQMLFRSEVNSLAGSLFAYAHQEADSFDYSRRQLEEAISYYVSAFPLYRTYISAGSKGLTQIDIDVIDKTLAKAKAKAPRVDGTMFDFIKKTLEASVANETAFRFTAKLQQLTGAVMAKSLEDTLFYRYMPLSSLNEVGGDPGEFGISTDDFHKANAVRARDWPGTMLGTSTHDSKRSEDVRARINAISEQALAWRGVLSKWAQHNASKKKSPQSPSPAEEYLIYQTLLGVWPANEATISKELLTRVKNYLMKAMREAKIGTAWLWPNGDHENNVYSFIEALVNDKAFVADFLKFFNVIEPLGRLNSVAQQLLKLTTPGVPDVYQGTELPDYSLVDPDNRRPIDYAQRQSLLETLPSVYPFGVVSKPEGKLFLTKTILNYRRNHYDLFAKGSYRPLAVTGSKADHIIAFAREYNGQRAITCITRFHSELGAGLDDTIITIPKEETASTQPVTDEKYWWKDLLLGTQVKSSEINGSVVIRAQDLFVVNRSVAFLVPFVEA